MPHLQISNSTRFSKYKNVDESSFFFLQKLKSTFRSPDTPTFRIITQHHPFYEVANGSDLTELRQNWDYLVNRELRSVARACSLHRRIHRAGLPKILPTHLSPKARQTWCARSAVALSGRL